MSKIKLPALGARFGGGFFMDCYIDGREVRALIASPRDKGEFQNVPWNSSLGRVAGALSFTDSLANTKAMAKAGSDIAMRALDTKIGGKRDWCIGARIPMLTFFDATRQVKAFQTGGAQALEAWWYWTSTQYGSGDGYAYVQGFGDGNQFSYRKSDKYHVRLVRSEVISIIQ